MHLLPVLCSEDKRICWLQPSFFLLHREGLRPDVNQDQRDGACRSAGQREEDQQEDLEQDDQNDGIIHSVEENDQNSIFQLTCSSIPELPVIPNKNSDVVLLKENVSLNSVPTGSTDKQTYLFLDILFQFNMCVRT